MRDGLAGPIRILIFEDSDGDGRFDSRKVFFDKGANFSGLITGFGGAWVCATPYLLFIPDRDGDDAPAVAGTGADTAVYVPEGVD